jgi:hypothetical protein
MLLPVGVENICPTLRRQIYNDNKNIESPMGSSGFIVILGRYICFDDQWKPTERGLVWDGNQT